MSELIVPDWPAPESVRALVTTRAFGNLGEIVGDDPEMLAVRREMLRRKLPAAPLWLKQVHETRCVRVEESFANVEADASIASSPGHVCAVLTADCLPLLLCDDRGTMVGAVHAGWRGLAAGVIELNGEGNGGARRAARSRRPSGFRASATSRSRRRSRQTRTSASRPRRSSPTPTTTSATTRSSSSRWIRGRPSPSTSTRRRTRSSGASSSTAARCRPRMRSASRSSSTTSATTTRPPRDRTPSRSHLEVARCPWSAGPPSGAHRPQGARDSPRRAAAEQPRLPARRLGLDGRAEQAAARQAGHEAPRPRARRPRTASPSSSTPARRASSCPRRPRAKANGSSRPSIG